MRGLILRIILALMGVGCGTEPVLQRGTYQVISKIWDLDCQDPTIVSDLYLSPIWEITSWDEGWQHNLKANNLTVHGEFNGDNDVVFKYDTIENDGTRDRLDTHVIIHAITDGWEGANLIARMQIYQTSIQSTPDPVPTCVNMWDVTGERT